MSFVRAIGLEGAGFLIEIEWLPSFLIHIDDDVDPCHM